MSESNEKLLNFYYDVSAARVIIGDRTLECVLEQGGHDFIEDLGQFLRDPLSVVDNPHNHRGEDYSSEECLEAGRWLLSILPEPDKPKEKKLNERILRKAGMIGITPGYRQIQHRFKTFTNYYRQLGEFNTHRTFFDLSDDNIVDYIGALIEELGRLPTADEIRERARENPNLVNYETLYTRLGGIIPAADKAGYKIPRDWSPEKFVNWGVAFRIANNARNPRQEDVDYFSSIRLCMSASSVKRKFDDRFSNFQKEVDEAFKRLKNEPRYKHVFYSVENGRFVVRDWVMRLKLPEEEKFEEAA